jgi:hypothetical protein
VQRSIAINAWLPCALFRVTLARRQRFCTKRSSAKTIGKAGATPLHVFFSPANSLNSPVGNTYDAGR